MKKILMMTLITTFSLGAFATEIQVNDSNLAGRIYGMLGGEQDKETLSLF